jgi:hypothetical protein
MKARIRISNPVDLAAALRRGKPEPPAVPPKFGKRAKYRSQKATYKGLPYDSRAEAAYAKWLDHEQAAGRVAWWNKAPAFRLGCPENVYRPDFLVVEPVHVVLAAATPTFGKATYSQVFLDDVKGTETRKFQRDKKLWAKYGPTTLRVVKLTLNYGKVDEDGLPSIRKVEYINIQGDTGHG